MAPLPPEAFTINGGCNCGAIRYSVKVPVHSERKPTPYRANDADIGDIRLPMLFICHCNGCRSSSSGIVLAGIAADMETLEVAVKPTAASEPAWMPASEVFDKEAVLADTSTALAVYESSPTKSRWFCRRCGTPFGYSIDAEHPAYAEWKWPPMFDLYMGTVDRADLERDWMVPDRRMWCEPGVPWIRKLIAEGSDAMGLPSHPTIDIAQKWDEP